MVMLFLEIDHSQCGENNTDPIVPSDPNPAPFQGQILSTSCQD